MTSAPRPERVKRSVGTKAGLDRDAIVTAARGLSGTGITMQAVADALGVDRSALNHHVASRAQLLRLAAEAEFAEGFAAVELPAGVGWQDSTRAYARAYATALLATGSLAEHLTPVVQETRFLRATEALLSRLAAAGFPDEVAVRFVITLGYVAHGWARDRAAVDARAEPRRAERTQAALRRLDRAAYPNLDRVSSAAYDTYGDEQLAFAVDAVIRGAQALVVAPASRG